jgi:hypothetical protein
MEIFGVPAANPSIAGPVRFEPIHKLIELAAQRDEG